jgi:hypothetical protein
MLNPRKLNIDSLEVESFPTIERPDVPAAPPAGGGVVVLDMQPGITDRSCTWCTLYQLPCC